MEAKQSSMGRRLERINAIRNAEYHAAAPSPGFEINLGRSSFRIRGGSDREIELLYSSLGLSGPDDFAIQPSVWAAAVRSHLDLSSRDDSTTLDKPPENQSAVDFEDFSASIKKSLIEEENGRTTAVIELHKEEESANEDCKVSSVLPLVRDVREEPTCIEEIKVGSVLPLPPGRLSIASPPSIRLPPIERADSTWDILKSFAPEEDDMSGGELEERWKEEGGGVRVGVTVNSHAESISKKADETVGLQMNLREEGGEVIGISPHGSLKRTISSWSKGDLLGSGSFGSVYEAISQ
jgi:mitogen-activated protein kinase kinase kinase 1